MTNYLGIISELQEIQNTLYPQMRMYYRIKDIIQQLKYAKDHQQQDLQQIKKLQQQALNENDDSLSLSVKKNNSSSVSKDDDNDKAKGVAKW